MNSRSNNLPAAHGFDGLPDAVTDADSDAIRAEACPRCALEQARDWASVTRWLARRGPEAHDALGVVCCPLHTWRLALVVSEGAAMDRMDRLTALYASALDHLLHDAQVAMRRLERTGVARWLMSSRTLAPGWFAERPACPLCARLAREMATSQESEQAGLEAGQEAPLCGEHRARAAGQERLARGEAAAAAHTRWWLAPGASAQDMAFIRRLLRAHDEPRFPDDLCPLCVARMRHERVLVAALAAGESFETVWLGPAEPLAEPLAGAAPERPDMRIERIDPATLCGRHTAQLRVSTQDAGGGADSASGDLAGDLAEALIGRALATDAPGMLRAETSERNCPACAILHAWELARIEGLHRAAGGAPLSESTTARLVWELEHARYPFCAPHLRRLLRFGPAETTWAALGPSLTRTLEDLRDRLEAAGQGDAGVLILPVIQFAAATLGGAPA